MNIKEKEREIEMLVNAANQYWQTKEEADRLRNEARKTKLEIDLYWSTL